MPKSIVEQLFPGADLILGDNVPPDFILAFKVNSETDQPPTLVAKIEVARAGDKAKQVWREAAATEGIVSGIIEGRELDDLFSLSEVGKPLRREVFEHARALRMFCDYTHSEHYNKAVEKGEITPISVHPDFRPKR